MYEILIQSGNHVFEAILNDSPTAALIIEILPVEGRVNTWGDEIYFPAAINCNLENEASADVAVGDIAFWPAGNMFCIFFGPTPVSEGNQPRAASAVNVIGKITSNIKNLSQVNAADSIRVSLA